MKFGGTSVADLEKIQNVSKIVSDSVRDFKIVVVLSYQSLFLSDLESIDYCLVCAHY